LKPFEPFNIVRYITKMYSISEIMHIITILTIGIYKGELNITNFNSPSEMDVISSFEIVAKS